ncbi:MAG: hypothetical protein ABGZ17_16630 [Planctomycetaceae bacterium]
MPDIAAIDLAPLPRIRYSSAHRCDAVGCIDSMVFAGQAAHMNSMLPAGPRVTQDIQLTIGDSINVGPHRVTVADVHGGDIRFHVETVDSSSPPEAQTPPPESPK